MPQGLERDGRKTSAIDAGAEGTDSRRAGVRGPKWTDLGIGFVTGEWNPAENRGLPGPCGNVVEVGVL